MMGIDATSTEYKKRLGIPPGSFEPSKNCQLKATVASSTLAGRSPLFFIVNVDLPDMSGFDLREKLTERWSRTPGYLISDSYDPQDEVKARCSGDTLYFCKHLEPGWLAAALRPATSKL